MQDRIGRDIDSRERIIGFIPEYAAYLSNSLGQGEDGKGPYERMKGKMPTILGIEFGEKLFCKEEKKQKLAVLVVQATALASVATKAREGRGYVIVEPSILKAPKAAPQTAKLNIGMNYMLDLIRHHGPADEADDAKKTRLKQMNE